MVAQLVKNPPTMWKTWVRSLGWEDALEKGKATHSSILAWRIPASGGSQMDMTEPLDFHFHQRTVLFAYCVTQLQLARTAVLYRNQIFNMPFLFQIFRGGLF